MGMGGKIGFGLRRRDAGRFVSQFRFDRLDPVKGGPRRIRHRLQTAIGVDQRPMGRRIHQRAFVMLSVDFHEAARNGANHLRARGLVIDEGARPSIRQLDAAQDQFAIGLDIALARQRKRGMVFSQVEDRRHLSLRLSLAHESAIAPRAKRQGQSIEEDGLSGAGFAGENRQAACEFEIELVDQHDVADREPDEHKEAPSSQSAGHDRMVDFRYPGGLIFIRRETAALQKIESVLIPLAIREIVPQHRRGCFRFAGDAEPEIGLGQAIQRLLGMAARLIIGQARCGTG